jgi:hypothetical protein
MRRYNKANSSNTIQEMAQRMNKHKYSENLEDDECFFFRVPKKLGAGTKKDPVHIMMTSRSLMENCNYLDKGVFQIDGTYRLTKNNYPWIVCGVVERRGKFHPITFMIANQVTEFEFTEFFEGLVDIANKMDIEFDPEYIMMDACDATYNAAKKVFSLLNYPYVLFSRNEKY